MCPFSYSRCATDIVTEADMPSLRLASCWSVVVRNGAYGERLYGLASTERTSNVVSSQRADQALGPGAVEVDAAALLVLDLAVVAEVGAARDPHVVDGVELAREHPGVLVGAAVEGALEVPVGRDPERHPLALAVDDQSGRDGLDPAGGQAGHDLLPEDRADLVAVEAVEDAARLLGLDEVHVELARVLGGLEDGGLGDLVEDHPLDRDALLGLQLVEQVPGDRLALAVLIGGEEELVGVLQQAP